MEVLILVIGLAALGTAASRWGVDSGAAVGDSWTDRRERWFPV